MSRIDARAKATGQARYVADVEPPGCLHVALVRSLFPRARVGAVDRSRAEQAPGVVGVFLAEDLGASTFGRIVRDVPILASGEVRFVGQRVAAVVAETRRQAREGAELVEVDYAELPPVLTPEAALAPSAPSVHAEAWAYPGAVIRPEDGRNLQSVVTEGDAERVDAALRASVHVIDRTYTTRAVHQGYLEPQACVAVPEASGRITLWLTNKSPYGLRRELEACLGIEAELIDVQPAPLGGDFGGKGSPQDAPLCIALARLVGRPVKLVLSYGEDLTVTDLRHPSRVRVRAGCDAEGRLTALRTEAVLDGGAYAGFKPLPDVSLHSLAEAPRYRIPEHAAEVRIAYTNTIPKGHMRAPGGPQASFAAESALDELAACCGLEPAELRRRNLLEDGEADAHGHRWLEHRGAVTLEAALEAASGPVEAPPGWLVGQGVAMYSRGVGMGSFTSLRFVPLGGGRLRIEIPFVETGTGAQTVVRELAARALGLPVELVEVEQVATDSLPPDLGVFGSRMTTTIALAVDQASEAWRDSGGTEPLTVAVNQPPAARLGAYSAQVARVAVDPETGQVAVLEIVSAVDVGTVVNARAHQMQIDGGTAMGFGYACLEDSDEVDGTVFGANLGEFKLPSARDLPVLRTVLVGGGRGLGGANVKSIGELTNVPTAAAIANAVAAAVGCRIRELPITAERVHAALAEQAGAVTPASPVIPALPG
jgi:CO/xanthine dehydrogenase Mo-binding subunit